VIIPAPREGVLKESSIMPLRGELLNLDEMARLGVVLLILATALHGADQKKNKDKAYKGPEVEILLAKAYRSESLVNVDARVRNCGVRPVRGLVVLFDFMAPGKFVITTQKMAAEQEILEPGEEVMLRGQLSDPVRAVQFRVQAVDQDDRDLRVAKPGPYPIE